MISTNNFQLTFDDGFIINFGQHENGMHWAELLENGLVTCGATDHTGNNIKIWIQETVNRYELKEKTCK